MFGGLVSGVVNSTRRLCGSRHLLHFHAPLIYSAAVRRWRAGEERRAAAAAVNLTAKPASLTAALSRAETPRGIIRRQTVFDPCNADGGISRYHGDEVKRQFLNPRVSAGSPLCPRTPLWNRTDETFSKMWKKHLDSEFDGVLCPQDVLRSNRKESHGSRTDI